MLRYGYYDDKKQKWQSHEIHLRGLNDDYFIDTRVLAMAGTKEDAIEEFVGELKKFEEVLKQTLVDVQMMIENPQKYEMSHDEFMKVFR